MIYIFFLRKHVVNYCDTILSLWSFMIESTSFFVSHVITTFDEILHNLNIIGVEQNNIVKYWGGG